MSTEAPSAADADSQLPADARTFAQLLRAVAAAYGDAAAVTLEEGGDVLASVTYRELEARSAVIARGLLARGIGKGARVGFIHGNGPAFAVMLAAVSRIGAVAVPISTMIRGNELVRVLRQSDVQGLVLQRTLLGKDYVARIGEALPELEGQQGGRLRLTRAPYLRWIVSDAEGLPEAIGGPAFLTEAAASVGEDLLREVEAEVHPTDQMVEIYTSGSMALPKGVRHAHGPVCFRSHTMREMMGHVPGKRVACILPMFWVGGLMMYLIPGLEAGATVVCSERTLSNSRFAMGSVPAEEDLAAMRGPRPWWGLGMSETLGPYSWGDDFRAPGRPVCAPMDHFAPGYEIRIADAGDRPVAAGEVGEMQVRGYPLASALHKIERAEHFTPDGYYRTGDMCLVEERAQGRRIHFVGRGGDMLKVSGSNVSPAEVEMELQALDGVHSAYVVGIPDRERGALLVAAVVARGDAVLDFTAIEAELRRRLSSYKVPRAYVAITREDVPLLHSNKVSRRELAGMMEARLRPGASSRQ
ncbi:class I adenylate-forming enzyme family protein [Novosphingobium resinovorum]|uniref:class I adenylate-forming enzyme family protein n=1 Tax=Novosphingobium resinovorum TaxID=158500 RepID=UPI002ED5DBA5|nr:class I adenylate-forming enzyme family protein [Novosphingobium resinovorum]